MLALLLVAPGKMLADEGGNARAMALLDQGEFAAAGGRFDRAKDLWQAALQQRPGWRVVQLRLAELPARRSGYAAHLEEIRRNQQASLNFVEGVSLFNQGRYREAASLFQGVPPVLPDHPYAAQYLDLAQAQAHVVNHGSLRVVANLPARIYLDGQPKGTTPLALEDLPAGEHVLSAEAHGVRVERKILIRGRATHAMSFVFREVEDR